MSECHLRERRFFRDKCGRSLPILFLLVSCTNLRRKQEVLRSGLTRSVVEIMLPRVPLAQICATEIVLAALWKPTLF